MDLFFDTETTGLPYKDLPLNHPKQPRLVQLGALLCDGQEIRSRIDLIIHPEISIPPEVVDIHGITDDMAMKYGVHKMLGVMLFKNLVGRADQIIGHNIDFDLQIMDIELTMCGIDNDIYPITFCTQQAARDIFKIPDKSGNNRPTLMETYKLLVDPKGFENAHSAYADAMACAQIYWAMQEK